MPSLNVALAYQGFVDEPVPSAIFDSIESGSAKRVTLIAMLIGALVTGAAITTIFNKITEVGSDVITSQLSTLDLAISAHNAYATDLVHPVQVNATDLEHLQSWLSYRVGNELSLIPLNDAGFTLLGASVLPDGATSSSIAIYENAQKERISVSTRYFTGSHGKSDVNADKVNGLNALSWEHQGALHTMVSDINTASMRNIIDKHF